MCYYKIPFFLMVFVVVFSGLVKAQEKQQRDWGRLSGSVESNWGFYMKDEDLGIEEVDDKVATNTYLTLGYAIKNFRFGI